MPGIDFALLRRQITLTQVLDLVGFTASTRRGPQLRGPCPVHRSTSSHSRSFAAHVEKNCWHCFRCGAGGNALDLYLAVTRLPVYDGALELCARLHIPVPRRSAPASRHAASCHAASRSPP
jgi:DNA primase